MNTDIPLNFMVWFNNWQTVPSKLFIYEIPSDEMSLKFNKLHKELSTYLPPNKPSLWPKQDQSIAVVTKSNKTVR